MAAEEKVFLSDNGVVVSNSRFSTGGQTYAMANVTSVRPARAGMGMGIILIIIGGAIAAGTDGGGKVLGVVLLAAGIVAIIFRSAYVILHTAGGEQRALESRDVKFVEKVVGAVNEAIVHRG